MITILVLQTEAGLIEEHGLSTRLQKRPNLHGFDTFESALWKMRNATVNEGGDTLVDGGESVRFSNNRGQNGQQQTASGIPSGLQAERSEDTDRLEQIIDRQLKRSKKQAGFKALAIGQDQLPDALRSALATIERATGTRVVVFRNLTPEIADFNGATVRDGLYLKPNMGDDPSMPSYAKSASTAETLTPLQKVRAGLLQGPVDLTPQEIEALRQDAISARASDEEFWEASRIRREAEARSKK